jgi:hypothetical protein
MQRYLVSSTWHYKKSHFPVVKSYGKYRRKVSWKVKR